MATIHFTTKPLELRTGCSDWRGLVSFIKTFEIPEDADVLRASSLFFPPLVARRAMMPPFLLFFSQQDDKVDLALSSPPLYVLMYVCTTEIALSLEVGGR